MSKTDVFVFIFLIIIIGLVIFAAIKAPCGFYKFAASKDVPARCLSEYTK